MTKTFTISLSVLILSLVGAFFIPSSDDRGRRVYMVAHIDIIDKWIVSNNGVVIMFNQDRNIYKRKSKNQFVKIGKWDTDYYIAKDLVPHFGYDDDLIGFFYQGSIASIVTPPITLGKVERIHRSFGLYYLDDQIDSIDTVEVLFKGGEIFAKPVTKTNVNVPIDSKKYKIPGTYIISKFKDKIEFIDMGRTKVDYRVVPLGTVLDITLKVRRVGDVKVSILV